MLCFGIYKDSVLVREDRVSIPIGIRKLDYEIIESDVDSVFVCYEEDWSKNSLEVHQK